MKSLTKIASFCFLLTFTFLSCHIVSGKEKADFYMLKVYHLKSDTQEAGLDYFLENAYLPALHREGIAKIGVFKPRTDMDNPHITEKLVYVFVPFESKEQFFNLEKQLGKDREYQAKGKEYLDAVYTNPPYERIETILLNAFEKAPRFELPVLSSPKKDRVYELRSYEGHTEKISKNKIQMFNKGDEVGLFKRLGFNAVFYAEVVAGSRMPNLMYLTTFENKSSRDQHWDSFGKDAYWKQLSAMPEYQKNVSKNEIRFLYPVAYSDI